MIDLGQHEVLSFDCYETLIDWESGILTAEQAKSYTPSSNNFTLAIERMGVSPQRILHIAQSPYHDIIPARRLGLATVWVNRRTGQEGFGVLRGQALGLTWRCQTSNNSLS